MPSTRLRTLFSAVLLAAALFGCIFSEGGSSSRCREPDAAGWPDTRLLDSVLCAPGGEAREVNLFFPYLDPDLGAGREGRLVQYRPVTVREEKGRLIRYQVSSRGFGSWSPEREYAWNYFHLRSSFLKADSLPDSAGRGASVPALYRSANDPFTRYVDSAAAEEEKRRLFTTSSPGIIGVRLRLDPSGDTVLIRSVYAGSPAEKAGLQAGDRFLEVNGVPVTGDSALSLFARATEGDSGKALAFRLLRQGNVLSVTVVKLPMDLPSVLADTLGGLGYIAVSGFVPNTLPGQSTASEFEAALKALPQKVLLLDLRDNGGGSLGEAMAMCEALISEGVIIRQRQRAMDSVYGIPLLSETALSAKKGGSGEGRFFVVLQNGASASASEILIAALKEGARSRLVGTLTYGKGIGQAVLTSPGGGLAIITFLAFRTRSGDDYHGVGIAPQDSVGGDPETVLQRAVAIGREQAGLSPLPVAKAGGKEGAKREREATLLEWNRRELRRDGVKPLLP